MRGPVEDQARSVVRVLDGGREVVGAGFLIGPDLVATCAHVVADALMADPCAPRPPGDPVEVDFPLADGAGSEPARARVHHWSPIALDGTGDVAVLRLDRAVPGGARMPSLRRVDALWDHGFRVLGFPQGQSDGVWATGRLRGEQGTRWFQLQGAPGDQAIVGGFSGTPVWDEASGAVVGMTVAADRSAATTTAYLIPIDRVLGIDPELLPCPYRGLEPFGEEHAEFFFGRDPDLARLVGALDGQPLVAVAGPSGVGKSSLVRAGLLPHQRAAGARVAELRAAAGAPPAPALAGALVPVLRPELDPHECAVATAAVAESVGSSDPAVRRAVAVTLTANTPEPGALVFVDQFEELAATEPEAARELLLLVVELVDSGRIRAVLTVRWESLTELMTPAAAEPLQQPLDTVLDAGSVLVAGTVLVGPMDRGRLRDAVVGPAERAPGLSFEPGLVDRILDDAGAEPGQLPLVESLLTELWEQRSGGYLTVSAYEAAGGVAGAVATRAEELLAEFGEAGEREELRRLLTLLAQPDRDGRFVRRPVPRAELAPQLQELVPRLAAGRLLVVQRDAAGAEVVELAHQALVEHWPRLRAWLADDRDFLAWRAQLDQQRERWEAAGHDPGALLRGTALASARQWLPARSAEVSSADQEYVRRSHARQRREVQRWRLITAVLASLVVAAGVLVVVATERGNRLDAQLRTAMAGNLGQQALGLTRTDPDLASRLALAAWKSDPTNPQARTALAAHFYAMQSVAAVHADVTTRPISDFEMGRDGDVMLLPDGPGRYVVLTGLAGRQPRRWVISDLPAGADARLSPDGSRLLTSAPGGNVRLWDVATRTATELPIVLPPQATTPRFGATGDRIVWLGPPEPGREVLIWDARTRAVVAHAVPPVGDGTYEHDTLLTGDPDTVLVRSRDPVGGTVRLVARSLSTGAVVRTFPVGSVTMGDGLSVARCQQPSGAGSASIVVADPASGAERRSVPLVSSGCSAIGRVDNTMDGGYVLEKRTQPVGADMVELRLLRPSDGAVFTAFVPPVEERSAGRNALEYGADVGVVRTPDGPVLLLPSGRSVLRIATVPEPALSVTGPSRRELVGDGGVVAAYVAPDGADTGQVVTFDRDTARELDHVEAPTTPALNSIMTSDVADGRLYLQATNDAGWWVDVYALPGLEQVDRFALPSPGSGDRVSYAFIDVEDGRLYARSDGALSIWDTATGEMVAGPVELGGTGPDPIVRPRPGHPEQVATLNSAQRVELWDVAGGNRVAVLGAAGDPPVFSFVVDRDGRNLATLGADHLVRVWDLERNELTRPPFAVPARAALIGFTAEGDVVTRNPTAGGGQQLSFWSPATGEELASVGLTIHVPAGVSADGRTLALDGYLFGPAATLPLTARQWRDRLCEFADRPFAPAELEVLPEGVDPGSPCD